MVTSLPGHRALIQFDGTGGISLSNATDVEISQLEVEGPNANITYEEAMVTQTWFDCGPGHTLFFLSDSAIGNSLSPSSVL